MRCANNDVEGDDHAGKIGSRRFNTCDDAGGGIRKCLPGMCRRHGAPGPARSQRI